MLLNFVDNYTKKRLCNLLNISKLKVVFHDKNSFIMHNLKTNFDKILDITKSFFKGSIDADGNYYFYPNKPKMSDCEVITLSVLCESIGIDSENYLFGKLNSDHFKVFPISFTAAGLTEEGSDWRYVTLFLYHHWNDWLELVQHRT